MPKDEYPMYEGVKEAMMSRGMGAKAAKMHAAKITNAAGKAVPPSRPKKKKKQ